MEPAKISPLLAKLGFTAESFQSALSRAIVKPDSPVRSGPTSTTPKQARKPRPASAQNTLPVQKTAALTTSALPPPPQIDHDFQVGQKVSVTLIETAAFSVNFEHTCAIILNPANYKGTVISAPNGSLWVEIEHDNNKYTRTLQGILINPRQFFLEKNSKQLK